MVQWGIVYAAGAWGVLQGLEYVTNTFDWPRQIQQLATLALLVGLPVVLVTAWYHGDQGRQRVSAAELIIIALLFLVGGGIFWRDDRANDVPSPATASLEQPGVASGMTAVVSDNSIAVLPFINMSGDPDNEYFSDGISEEILNVQAGTPQLKVAARTSSFSFKGKPMEVPEIAAALNVRMVLEGSVRRQADTVRITAQLIAAQTGFHIWSQTYDRKLEDIFAIQDEIVRAIHSVRAPVAAARDRLRRVVFPRATSAIGSNCCKRKSGQTGCAAINPPCQVYSEPSVPFPTLQRLDGVPGPRPSVLRLEPGHPRAPEHERILVAPLIVDL